MSCENPWQRKNTKHDGKTHVMIYYKGKLLEVCKPCFIKMLKKNREW